MSNIDAVEANPALAIRYPLGLPAGSVRGILSFIITGLLVTIILLPPDQPHTVPLFLYFLTSLILAFFVAHSGGLTYDPNDSAELGLPRGVLRAIMLIGVVAAFGYAYYLNPTKLYERLTPQPDQLKQWPILALSLAGGFVVGVLIGKGPWRRSPLFLDAVAWVSLISMIGLGVETVAVLFINPSLEKDLNLAWLESFLTAAVSFYFGVRSHSR